MRIWDQGQSDLAGIGIKGVENNDKPAEVVHKWKDQAQFLKWLCLPSSNCLYLYADPSQQQQTFQGLGTGKAANCDAFSVSFSTWLFCLSKVYVPVSSQCQDATEESKSSFFPISSSF